MQVVCAPICQSRRPRVTFSFENTGRRGTRRVPVLRVVGQLCVDIRRELSTAGQSTRSGTLFPDAGRPLLLGLFPSENASGGKGSRP